MENNYQTLTDSELDKLAAEMCGWYIVQQSIHNTGFYEPWYYSHGDHVMRPKDWNPTHPDSNQAERYLFPKIQKEGIHMGWSSSIWCIDIGMGENVVFENCDAHDQINRTKVIACLEAWEKIK